MACSLSKDKNKVAAIVVINKHVFSARLYIFGRFKGFDHIKMSKHIQFTIFSASLSCSRSLHNMNIGNLYILNIFQVRRTRREMVPRFK